MITIIIREPCNSPVVRTARNLFRGKLQAVEQSAEGFGYQTELGFLPGVQISEVVPTLREISLQTRYPITLLQDGHAARAWRTGQESQKVLG